MKNFILFALYLLLFSCSKKTELEKILKCKTTKFENVSSKTDFNKNFILNIPTTWKTDLYFDKNVSEIFSADTTKQLSDAYILGASHNFGTIQFDAIFKRENDSILNVNSLKIIKAGEISFQNKPAYFYIAQGTRNNLVYHKFNITVLLGSTSFFNAYSEVFGNKNVDERICESISLIQQVKFLQ
ncbi:hypothetical protein [Lutibacter sp.]|uniref:hypothetical protein n=1 Tax=Lutibacter sp. TaxID=1925666 RepID=UPI002735CC38|nr:hypothetical protein [Lutibacter sp.]MDP3313243.1 hypothetical protein [Lutibacter sp.]